MELDNLECPSCGSSKISPLGNKTFQCDYCGSVFIEKNADNNKAETPVTPRAAEIKKNADHTPKTPEPIIDNSLTAFQWFKIAAFLIGIVLIVLYFKYGFSSPDVTATPREYSNEWRKDPKLVHYACCMPGSRGAAVWLILRNTQVYLDSVKFLVRIVDPVSKKTIAEQPLFYMNQFDDASVFSARFGNVFYASNDTVYNVSPAGGIQGFDLYTGKRLFGNNYFETKFPSLKKGIYRAELELSKGRIKILSRDNNYLYYYFDEGRLLTTTEDLKRSTPDDFEKSVYLSETQQAQLYLCNAKKDPKEAYYISESVIEQFRSNPSYKTPDLKSIKKLNDAIYLAGMPLKKYNDQLLFFYADNTSAPLKGVLALADKNGRITWRNSDPEFSYLLKGESIRIPYHVEQDMAIISINNKYAVTEFVGVDLETGKTLFVYHQDSNLE